MKHLALSLLFGILALAASAQTTGPATLQLIGDSAYAYNRSVPTGARTKAELYNRARRFLRTELDASDNLLLADSTTFDSLQSVGYLRLPDGAGLSNLVLEFTATFRPEDGGLRFEARDFTLHGFEAGAESFDWILEDLRGFTPEQQMSVYRALDARWTDLAARLDRLGR